LRINNYFMLVLIIYTNIIIISINWKMIKINRLLFLIIIVTITNHYLSALEIYWKDQLATYLLSASFSCLIANIIYSTNYWFSNCLISLPILYAISPINPKTALIWSYKLFEINQLINLPLKGYKPYWKSSLRIGRC
jgi:hypothetical protein